MRGDYIAIMKTKKIYVDPEVKVIIFDFDSDIITSSSDFSVKPPDLGDIDQDSWI